MAVLRLRADILDTGFVDILSRNFQVQVFQRRQLRYIDMPNLTQREQGNYVVNK